MASTDRPCAQSAPLTPRTLSVVIPCFRDAERAARLAMTLSLQALPPEVSLDIVVVDDGSGDDCLAALLSKAEGRYRVLALPTNRGRSAARNAGARDCTGDVLVFLDADCLPLNEHFLATHLHAHGDDVVATTGHVRGTGNGFWSRYQDEASERRLKQFRAGLTWVGASSNLTVTRKSFESLGGFDEEYGRYGFEDRDLLIRLSRIGTIAWVDEASVTHLDALDLTGVTRKMIEAGRHSSSRFAERHPLPYRQLGYGRIDLRALPLPGVVAKAAGASLSAATGLADRVLESRALPMWLRVAVVRSLSAAAYAYGTLLSTADTRRKSTGRQA